MIEFVCPQSSEECEPGQVRNEAALSISLLWLGRFFYKDKYNVIELVDIVNQKSYN